MSALVGMQWCSACEPPRFKWTVGDIKDVPERRCLHCGKNTIEARFVAEGLAGLRRELGAWALGQGSRASDRAWLSRRRAIVRQKFDIVVGWWSKQPSLPKDAKRALDSYRNRGKPTGSPPTEEVSRPVSTEQRMLDPKRLHDLAEQMKRLAEEERTERARAKPRK